MGTRRRKKSRRTSSPSPEQSPWDAESEPRAEGDEWVECGGQRIWAAGFTSWGFPYGITLEEFREGNEDAAGDADWARAKRLLRSVFEHWPGLPPAEIDIGWINRVGEGLSRKAFAAEVGLSPDRAGLSGTYVVLLPRRDAEPFFDERTRFEASLLTRLSAFDLPLRIPRCLGLLPSAGRPALIETYIEGIPLDLRAGRQSRTRPWEIVARVAAAVHALDPEALAKAPGPPWTPPGHKTRREHALAALAVFHDTSEPLLRDIREWILEHLPPEEPSVLLHGDLLGQNIRLPLDDAPLGLIDWERARLGDPASDLAIVTRGVKRPFQIDHGLDRLLESYARQGAEIRKEHVHLHELSLMAAWYRDSFDAQHRTHPPEVLRGNLQGHFRRVTGREAQRTPGA